MRKKIIIYNLLITAISLLLMFALGLVVTSNNNFEQAKTDIINITKIYVSNYEEDNNYTENALDNIRITIISSEGKVLKDSSKQDVSQMENHLGREEIISALNNTPKVVNRDSETINQQMLYYAEKVNVNDSYIFLRVAMPVKSINNYLINTLPLMIAILITALTFSVLMSMVMGKNVLKPINKIKNSLSSIINGTYEKTFVNEKDEEMNQIIYEVSEIEEKVQENINNLKEQSGKLKFILNNINDGIFAIDKSSDICLINEAAQKIFSVNKDIINKNISNLCYDKKLLKALEECIENKENFISEVKINNSIYLITIKNLGKGWTEDINTEYAIVILTDITNTKNNEKLRSDFFANSSHELKTPLTSINGFNELLSINNKDEKLTPYINQIAKESQRMLKLIEDMLKLSKLENTTNIIKTKLEVSKIINDVKTSLSTMANEKNILINVSGTGIIYAEENDIFELFNNLIQNSIKYNNQNGKVDIKIYQEKEKTIVSVKDDGIGIDEKNLGRIFERFYRVEKSRSRATGGTGLGLAIVKHICENYGAEISIKSKLGLGTEIIVKF